MNLKWFEDFLSVVDSGNFTRSAELTNSTQSALSRRIKSLEEWVGAELFERSVHPVTLTPEGELLKPYAEEILRRTYQAREAVRQSVEASHHTVHFMATHSLALTFFPSWLRELQSSEDDLQATFSTQGLQKCFDSLANGQADLVLCHVHPASALLNPDVDHVSVAVGADRLVPVSYPAKNGAPSHSLASGGGAPAKYLSFSLESSIGRAIQRMIDTRSDELNMTSVFSSDHASVLKSMTLENYGFSWLPYQDVRKELEDGRLVRAADESWDIPVDIRVFRLRATRSARLERLWPFIEGQQKAR